MERSGKSGADVARSVWLGLACLACFAALYSCANFEGLRTRRQHAEAFEEALAKKTRQVLGPLAHPLTLDDCVHTALVRNLDLRVRELELCAARQETEEAFVALLPELSADLQYTHRSNKPYSKSQYLLGGGGIRDSYATSQHRDHLALFGRLLISPLDFGLALLGRKQKQLGERVRRMERLRMAQRIVADVEAAYARLEAAQSRELWLGRALTEAEHSRSGMQRLHRSKRITFARLEQVAQVADRARSALREAHRARIEVRRRLAALLGIDPMAKFEVKERSIASAHPLSALEDGVKTALRRRPELFASDLRIEQRRMDVTRSWLSLLPNVRLFANYSYDDNDFLLYDNYTQMGAGVVLNLMDSLFGFERVDVAKARSRVEIGDRDLAAMGVLTQVGLAHLEWGTARHASAQAMDALELATRSFQETKSRHRKGLVSRHDFEMARIRQCEAQAAAASARAELRAASAEYRAATGTILDAWDR